MSTNPFRQIRTQQDPGTFSPVEPRRVVSDGNGPKGSDLSVNTNVPPGSLERHVSFASPPVDTTIPAASYPSSPESVRFSPPAQHWQPAQPATPNYRSAFFSDPFQDLGRDGREDQTINEALQNAQSNAVIGQTPVEEPSDDAVRDTLRRFAAAAPKAQPPAGSAAPPPAAAAAADARKSLDVDAFKRLLLTGDSGQNTPGTVTPPPTTSKQVSDDSSGTSLSQQSIFDQAARSEETPRSSHEIDRAAAADKPKVPPPAPAPRRGKSVKHKTASEASSSSEPAQVPESVEKPAKKPPTPPLSRRHSHRSSSIRSEEGSGALSEASTPTESLKPAHKAPPPPPMRRQHSVSQRPSNDLAPTIEEPEPEHAPSVDNPRSPNERPQPPSSRNSSTSIKRQSLGLMNPPPLPPPRKGRGSSRSSMDSFRPSVSSITGEPGGPDHVSPDSQDQRGSITPSNAQDILAELANLQKEVDAARRGA